MKRTKAKRVFNQATGKYDYTPAVITNFHCNVEEYFNNNGKRSTFFKQLRKHLFGEDYMTFVPEHEELDIIESILNNRDVYHIIEDHEEWTTVGTLDDEKRAEEVIKKIVKCVTGREPEVNVYQNEDGYFRDLTICFRNTKVPTLKYIFNDDFYYDFEEDYPILAGIHPKDRTYGEYVEKFYKFVLDGLYLLFKNMQSEWGLAHPKYFYNNSTFTYEYKDWKVDKVKK